MATDAAVIMISQSKCGAVLRFIFSMFLQSDTWGAYLF